MERYVDGDSGAFEELFRRYESRTFAYFLKHTRSGERARDLYQELFLRLHRARDSYDSGRPFAPWFFQIAHRLLIDDQRRAYRSHEVPLDRSEPHDARSAADDVTAQEQLAGLLDSLSPDERLVVVAAKLEGVAYSELAVRLGKSVDAVKKMASRAVLRLREAASRLPNRG